MLQRSASYQPQQKKTTHISSIYETLTLTEYCHKWAFLAHQVLDSVLCIRRHVMYLPLVIPEHLSHRI